MIDCLAGNYPPVVRVCVFAYYSRPATRNAVLLYSTFSFGVIGLDELYSLWCSEPAHLGESHLVWIATFFAW